MDTCAATALPVPSSSLDELEHRITELAANYRLLCLIAEFDRRRGWCHWGVRSCAHWLSWKCGIGPVAARDKVRFARSLASLPGISEAFRRGQVSYSKVRAMTRVATPENEDYLLRIARHGPAEGIAAEVHGKQSYSARRADARVLMAESLLASGAGTRGAGERNHVIVHMDADVLADPDAPGRSELENGPGVAGETARRLACDASVVRLVEDAHGTPRDVGRKTRSIPPTIQRALRARDRGCRFPGCTARHFIEGHHVKHWARGGQTSLQNLVQLCQFHYRLVHEGGFAVRVCGPRHFEFTRPDGRVIEAVPKNDSAESLHDTDVETSNREHDLAIDANTCVTLWDGTRMDHAMAVEALLHRDGALQLDPATGHYPAHFPPAARNEQ